MKQKMMLLALLTISAGAVNAEVTMAPVKHLYIPEGFDNNDSVEVVVTGNFPTPCYARNTVSVDFKDDQVLIEVTAIKRETKAGCPDMVVPFKEVVSLGNLQGGKYNVIVNKKLKDDLTINEASSNSVDEHLYAAIDQLEEVSTGDYILRGWRYSGCITLDHVEVVSNGKDTLSVLPVMKHVSNFCPMKMMPVAYPVKLDFSALKINEPLVHVRTMDGKSFNSIIHLVK